MNLTTLSYNVFIGSPCESILKGGGATLHKSKRLLAQLNSIEKLRPDIVCLQGMDDIHACVCI